MLKNKLVVSLALIIFLSVIQARSVLDIAQLCSGDSLYYCSLTNINEGFDLTRNTSASNLEELIVRNSPMGRLPPELFSQAPRLQSLNLQNCSINRLSLSTFTYATKLRQLFMASNRLSYLPEKVFDAAYLLQQLQLSHNMIHLLHRNTFAKLEHLRFLDLQHNVIEELPDAVFQQLHDLEHLDLSDNEIKKIDFNTFATNAALRTLILSGNKFTVFESNALSHMTQLNTLDISHTQGLDSLELVAVDTLLAKYGQLKRLVVQKFITRFIAPHNQLSEFLVGDKISVRELDLSDNNFTNLDYFKGMWNLQSLDVSHNKINSIFIIGSTPTLLLPSLNYLNLSWNQLFNISANNFLMLSKLRHLDLSYNNLVNVDVSTFEPLLNLEHLYLEGNRLHTLDFVALSRALPYLNEMGIFDNEWENRFLQQMLQYLRSHDINIPIRYHSNASSNQIANDVNNQFAYVPDRLLESLRTTTRRLDLLAVLTLVLVLAILVLQLYRMFQDDQCFGNCMRKVRQRRINVFRNQRLSECNSEI